jgi:hypothetical protein
LSQVGKYRDFALSKEPFAQNLTSCGELAVKKIKRKKFIKSLFLCLFLLSTLSVDNVPKAFIFNVYRDSKPCGHVPLRGLDNRCKPVD